MAVYQSITDTIDKTPMVRLKSFEPRPNIEIYAELEYMNSEGNTGLGIALAAIGHPSKLIFTVPEKFSVEKITLLKVLGAEVVLTLKKHGMTGAITRAEQIWSAIPDAIKTAEQTSSGRIVVILTDLDDR